jgi:hypothetical protein
VTTFLLAGAGEVGARAGRQLVETPGLTCLLVTDRDHDRATALAAALGNSAQSVPFDGFALEEVSVVAAALPATANVRLARSAVRAGVSVAATGDEDARLVALLALDASARAAGVGVVAGCGLVPGLSEVLARHAANALDLADEVHVARAGTAGPECVAALRRVRRERALEWHDGAWRSERRVGRQLVWFPDPVGARECETAGAGVTLMRDAVPGVRAASVWVGEPPARHPLLASLNGVPADNGWGAARVEVWGCRGGARESIVYGVIEHPAVAAGTVLAVTAARLAGLLPGIELQCDPVGASGLGTLVDPTSFLAELARRGVKAATFEGVAVA